MIDDFDLARGLVFSYYLENAEFGSVDAARFDARLPELFRLLRELCPDGFHRILVLANAIKDERFEAAGLADVLPLIRSLQITDDVAADTEKLLAAMEQEDAAIWKAACSLADFAQTLPEGDSFRLAAERLLQ